MLKPVIGFKHRNKEIVQIVEKKVVSIEVKGFLYIEFSGERFRMRKSKDVEEQKKVYFSSESFRMEEKGVEQ